MVRADRCATICSARLILPLQKGGAKWLENLISALAGPFVELFVKGAKFEVGLKKAAASLKKFGDDITAIGTKLASFGTVMGTGIGLAAKRFADFDDTMLAAGAVSSATEAELAKLTATAEKLGASTSFTAVEVGSLMTELGRAGFTADQIDKMTGSVLSLARATGTDATLASGIMSATIRQFGLEAGDAGRVADAFTVAANKSFNTVEQLGEALNYAGPVAADFGMTLEETLAIFGGLGNMGIQASNAGTAVRRLLTMTGSEADKMKDIFGVTFKDAAGNARPLVDVLEEVTAATAGLGTGDRAAKFNEAFGLLGITAASAIGHSAVSIRDLKKALDEGGGVAEKTAAKMDSGLGGSIRILTSAVEGVAIKLGRTLAPTLQAVAAYVTDLAGEIIKWIDNNRELVVALTGAIAAVTAIGFSLVATGLAASLVAASITGLATLFGALLTGVTALLTPFGLITAAIVALGAVIVSTTGILPKLVDQFKPLIGAITTIATSLMSGDFKKAWDVAASSIKYVASVALDWFVSLPELAGYAAGAVARALIDGLSVVWEWVKSMPSLIEAMLSGDMSLGDMMSGAMESALGKIKSTADAMKAGFRGDALPELGSSERTKKLREALDALTGEDAKKAGMSNQMQNRGRGGKLVADAKAGGLGGARPGGAGGGGGDGPVTVTFSGAALVAQTFGGRGVVKPEDKIVLELRAQLAEAKRMEKILADLLKEAKAGKLVFGA